MKQWLYVVLALGSLSSARAGTCPSLQGSYQSGHEIWDITDVALGTESARYLIEERGNGKEILEADGVVRSTPEKDIRQVSCKGGSVQVELFHVDGRKGPFSELWIFKRFTYWKPDDQHLVYSIREFATSPAIGTLWPQEYQVDYEFERIAGPLGRSAPRAISAPLGMAGKWEGKGTLSNWAGRTTRCDLLALTVGESGTRWNLDFGYQCPVSGGGWGPAPFEVHDQTVYEWGEQVGSFDGHSFISSSQSGGLKRTLKLTLGQESPPTLEVLYRLDSAAGAIIFQGTLTRVSTK